MAKQALVIGLGHFGMAVAQALTELGVEVLAVDRSAEQVERAAVFAAEAACFDATDEAALARAAPDRRDVCVCGIGDEDREASFICTALLRQLGARRILARATDQLHERILRLVGAHETLNPEWEFGRRIAAHVAYSGVIGEYPLSEGLAVTELRVPEAFAGRTLADLQLPSRHGITVVAIQGHDRPLTSPTPNAPLGADDTLVVVAEHGAVARLMERLG